MTIGGISLLFRIAGATQSSSVRAEARRMLLDRIIFAVVVVVAPLTALGVFAWAIRSL